MTPRSGWAVRVMLWEPPVTLPMVSLTGPQRYWSLGVKVMVLPSVTPSKVTWFASRLYTHTWVVLVPSSPGWERTTVPLTALSVPVPLATSAHCTVTVTVSAVLAGRVRAGVLSANVTRVRVLSLWVADRVPMGTALT